MSRTKLPVLGERDPVELLLKRIARRGMAGTLLGGAASLVGACSSDDGTTRVQDPVMTGTTDASAPADAATHADASAIDAATPYDAASLRRDASTGTLACSMQGGPQVEAANLGTSVPFDYVSVRRVSGAYVPPNTDPGPEDWSDATPSTTLSEVGRACATATSPACSVKALENPTQLVSPTDCYAICSELSVVTTRGDDVERWAGSARLRQLLAPIDSADEVALVVLAAGYDVPCEMPVTAVADGYQALGTKMTSDCLPIVVTGYQLHVSPAGELTELSSFEYSRTDACVGRIPRGLKSVSVDLHRSVFGDHLAHCAHLEAASVVAFERLADELTAHGAPLPLIEDARRAALDEVRHACVIGLLARTHRGQPADVDVEALATRTLEQIALENATEGCVRETFGALVGAYQAEHAQDIALAQVMGVIAEDEARHAALSHRVHRWALSRLDAAARARVQQAQSFAIAALRAECMREPHPELRAQAGLPSAQLSCAFVDELSRELWRDVAAFAA